MSVGQKSNVSPEEDEVLLHKVGDFIGRLMYEETNSFAKKQKWSAYGYRDNYIAMAIVAFKASVEILRAAGEGGELWATARKLRLKPHGMTKSIASILKMGQPKGSKDS